MQSAFLSGTPRRFRVVVDHRVVAYGVVWCDGSVNVQAVRDGGVSSVGSCSFPSLDEMRAQRPRWDVSWIDPPAA